MASEREREGVTEGSVLSVEESRRKRQVDTGVPFLPWFPVQLYRLHTPKVVPENYDVS